MNDGEKQAYPGEGKRSWTLGQGLEWWRWCAWFHEGDILEDIDAIEIYSQKSLERRLSEVCPERDSGERVTRATTEREGGACVQCSLMFH